MIKIVAKRYLASSDIYQYFYTCKHCGRELIFFKLSPKVCNWCDEKVPRLGRLIGSKERRVEHHFE